MKINKLIIGGIFVLMIAAIVFLWIKKAAVPVEPPASVENPPTQPPQPQSVATPGTQVKPMHEFASMGVLERNAAIQEIKKKDLAMIFHLWQDANRVDHDLMEQGAIQTALAYELRKRPPTPALLAEMRQYVADGSNSLRERVAVIGIFSLAATKEAIDFLLQIADAPDCKDLRQDTIQGIAVVGEHSGGGPYHEDISPALEGVWRESSDPDMLYAAAVSMAQVGAPNAIESLLSAALQADGKDDVRKQTALGALEKVYTNNAVPPVAALLAAQPPSSTPASTLAGNVLVKIGDSSAAKALLGWVQSADDSAAIPVRDFIAQTRTPAMIEAWNAALNPTVVFRSEQVRKAIRAAMMEYQQNYMTTR